MTVPARKPRSTRPKRDHKGELLEWMQSEPASLGLDWTVKQEHVFHSTRKWRLDYAWISSEGEHTKIAVEFDGIMMRTVGHNGLGGILRDSEKINNAQALGWQVYRANAKTIENGTFYALMTSVLIERARISE